MRDSRRRFLPGRTRLLMAAPLLLALLVNHGRSTPAPEPGGTLAKIHASGTVTLGVRRSAMPFSYFLPEGQPAGYAVDICRALVEDISAALGGQKLRIEYRPVFPEDRIDLVVSGAIDIECGSTTRNEDRLRRVAFSPVFFISGTKLMVPRDSPIRSYRDLTGRTVVVTAGTTNEAAIHTLEERMLLRMKIVTTPDHAQSFALLRSGKADAFATDEVLLAGLAAMPEGAGFMVVGGFLSYDPYGLVFRKDDPEFAAVIDKGFHRLAASGTLRALYTRWLQEPLPTGENLNIPMSAELAQIFRQLGEPDYSSGR